jgi:hypothetical protein
MQNENVIIWQKWIDPFGRDDVQEQEEFSNYFSETDHDDEEDKENKEFLANKIMKYGIKVIATPLGIIPVNDNTSSGKIFNFWMGHTNFDITKKVAETIEKTEGVESLDIYTRYRFRISVGKAFDDSYVMRIINKNVYKELNYAYKP